MVNSLLANLSIDFDNILEVFKDIFPKEIPHRLHLIRGIEHQIDFVPGASLPNCLAYRTNLEESKGIQRVSKEEHESMCYPSYPCTKKDGTWHIGYIVGSQGFKVDEEKVKATQSWLTPKESDTILTSFKEEYQEDKENMDTKELQGLITRGRMRRLQEEVVKMMGLLRSLEKPTQSQTIYYKNWPLKYGQSLSPTLDNISSCITSSYIKSGIPSNSKGKRASKQIRESEKSHSRAKTDNGEFKDECHLTSNDEQKLED
ncbi:hypothetical protein CR513_02084, partial [Mucuna pruriens]